MKRKTIAVMGAGRFGSSIAEALCKQGHEVLVIDKNEEKIQNILPKVTHGVVGDVTDEKVLMSLGIRNFDIGVVAIGGDIQSSILVTLILKEAGIKYILAKAQGELHSKVLYRTGADRVIQPEKDMGIRAAQNLASKNILDHIDISTSYSIVEIVSPKKWLNKTLSDLNIRVEYGVNIIAIKKNKNLVIAPKADYTIRETDILLIIGLNEDISKVSDLE